jgi:hypothetical protein
MFTQRFPLTIALFLILLAACAVPQNGAAPSVSVQSAHIQNSASAVTHQQPNQQATATPTAAATQVVTTTTSLLTDVSNAPLQVISTSPAKDAEEIAVSRNETKIIVQFNHPVVPLVSVSEQSGLPQPLSFTPSLNGSGIWINTSTYSFTPSQNLQVATTYTVNVAPMTDMLGAKLDGYTWKFATASPEVILSYPETNTQNAGVREPISVTFNTEMDRASVEARFSVATAQGGAAVAGKFEWNGAQMKFVPDKPLAYNTLYRATLKAGAQDISQKAATKKDTAWNFRTSRQPGVLSTTPKNGDQSALEIRNGFQITYASPMAQDVVTVTIQPTITNQYSYWESSTKQTISGGWLASQTYTVTISGKSETVYGEMLGKDTVVVFTAAPLDPDVYLNVNGTAGLYDANQPQLIYVTYRNVSEIDYALYTMPRSDLLRAVGSDRYQYWDNYKPNANHLLREWKQDVSAPLNASRVISTSLGGDTPSTYLKPGAYYLEARTASSVKPASRSRHILIVTPYNLALKRSETNALVWATDLSTGKPVADLPITIYTADGKATATGKTDKDGVYQGAFPRQEYWQPLFAVSEQDGAVQAAVGSDWNDGIQTFDFNLNTQYGAQEYYANLYTDRAIYRPGQSVYFKGILRRDHDAQYSLPTDMKTVPIKVIDANGREILSQDLPLNAYGTFNGTVQLSQGASLGYYSIVLEFDPDDRRFYSSVSFQVAEYKAPEFQVAVKTDRDSYINGETIHVDTESTYYFGGAVSDAKVQWRLLSDDLFFSTDKVKGYWDFTDYDLTANRQRTGGVVSEGKGTTDKQGKFSFTVPADLKDYPLSQNFTIDVEITDINNSAVSSRVVVPVHKGQFYIGLKPQSYVGEVNKKQGVDVITVNPQGDPSPQQPVTISVYEHKWFSVREKDADGNFYWKSSYTDTLLSKVDVTTDISGTATAYYTPTVGGVYKIAAEGKDTQGNMIRSATYQWIPSAEFVNWRVENNDRIDLVPDKKEYRVGETAKVLVPAPFTGAQALLTIERGGILQVKSLGVIGNSETLEIPITQDFIPTAYVSVMLVKGRTSDSPTPQFKLGYAALNINPADKILNVKITPDGKLNAKGLAEYQPGDRATFNVEVTDASGKPAQAEFSVALVDKAVQALADDRSTPLDSAFWGTRGIGVQTSASWVRSVERINQNVQAEAKGGGGGGPEETSPVRRNFQDTAFWKADVVTDANGKASVTVALPDNLTTWNFTAKGVTKETLVGTGKLDIVETKPVLVRPVVPRFFVPGDTVQLEAVVNNNTAQDVTVDVKLQATGLTLSSSATQPLTVKANDKAQVSWQTTVNKDANAVQVQFSASGSGYSDALAATLPVVRPLSPETVGTSGTVDAKVAEKIQVPANVDASAGGLQITASPSLAAASLQSLDYLQAFPYDCSEQVVSKFYPNVVTYQALKEFGVQNAALEKQLTINISQQIQRLYQLQHGDGGWGLWANDTSIPHTTAYVVLALDAANKAGFAVDQNVIQRGRDYLNGYLDQPTDANQAYRYNQRAFVIFVLNETSETNEYNARALSLYDRRAQLDNYAKAYLMMALYKAGSKTQAQALLQDLTANAVPSATGTHWEEKQPDWFMMNTDTRTTAIVLLGIARVDPQNALLKNAVRWLMTQRAQGHWGTTQETAWSVLGLTEYMKQSGELNADYTYEVTVNNKALGQETVSKDNVTENKTFSVAMKDLLTSAANELLFTRTEGPGNLYYSAFLNYYLPAENMPALDRGILVARQYFKVDQATLKPTAQQITSANVGDYVQVKLTIIAPTNLHYLLVEDPLPSGFEAVDTSLKTTSAGASAPELEKDIRDCEACKQYYYPYWYYWSNTELRDDRVALFADYLSTGTYEYTYLMRASVSGNFTVLPTTAQQMYEPDVFGRSNGARFVVK